MNDRMEKSNENLTDRTAAIYAKIERTEEKIEKTHDRIVSQLTTMVDLLKPK